MIARVLVQAARVRQMSSECACAALSRAGLCCARSVGVCVRGSVSVRARLASRAHHLLLPATSLATHLPRPAAASASAASPATGGVANLLGKTLFRGNVTYLSYIFGGAVVLELVYGTVLDGLWNGLNRGVSAAAELVRRVRASAAADDDDDDDDAPGSDAPTPVLSSRRRSRALTHHTHTTPLPPCAADVRDDGLEQVQDGRRVGRWAFCVAAAALNLEHNTPT